MARRYDSTVARIAGNILSGRVPCGEAGADDAVVIWAVKMARAIVAEVERTEPKPEDATTVPCCQKCGAPGRMLKSTSIHGGEAYDFVCDVCGVSGRARV